MVISPTSVVKEVASWYNPHDEQLKLHASGNRFIVAAAGSRAGKTLSCCVEFVHRIIKDVIAGKQGPVTGKGRLRTPSLRYYVVAPTFSLTREAMKYIVAICEPIGMIERQYDGQIWLKGDILVEAKSADNPLTLVAVSLNGLLMDEAARCKPDAWRGQLRQRLIDKQGWAIFCSTPLGRNWFYADFVEKHGTDLGDPQVSVFRWTAWDNPYLARGELEGYRDHADPSYYRREVMASFDAFVGTIYNQFNEKIHVTSEKELRLAYNFHGPLHKLFRRVIAGVDWGDAAPGCIVVVGDLGEGRVVVLDESYASGRTFYEPSATSPTWIGEARRLQELYHIEAFYADPSGKGHRGDFNRLGLTTFAADNEISHGIKKTKEAMVVKADGSTRFQVFSNCKNVIRELKSYVWADRKGYDDFQEKPADGQSDHSLDALRYSIVELTKHLDLDIKKPDFYINRFNPIA